jgi:hypothetical protein
MQRQYVKSFTASKSNGLSISHQRSLARYCPRQLSGLLAALWIQHLLSPPSPLSTQPFFEQSAYMPIFYTLTYCNPFESVYSLFGAACNSLSLLKKNRELQALFLFRYEEPRDILKRSDTAFLVSLQAILFVFVASVSISLYTHNFYYRYSRRKKYAKWEF